MIQLLAKHTRKIAFLSFAIFYCNVLLAGYTLMRSYDGEMISFEGISSYHGAHYDLSSPYLQPTFKDRVNFLNRDVDNPVTAEARIFNNITVVHSGDRNQFADDIGGPTQPEMQAFQSVNSNNMVDLFTGDFSYNIPLMDVGGYPVNLSYRSGISMDQEASWVGLGWNINPGTITRNLRGIPDDFDGGTDTIRQITHTKPDVTVGADVGAGFELFGGPINLNATAGFTHNSRTGWGLEYGVGASLSAGVSSKGTLTSGLSLTNSTKNGLSVSPSLSFDLKSSDDQDNIVTGGNASARLNYNSRSGLNSLQLSAGPRQYTNDYKNQGGNDTRKDIGDVPLSGSISFALPSYTPSLQIPYTSANYTFTGKIGGAFWGGHPNFSITGFYSTTYIAPSDTSLTLPAYGYLHYQDANNNPGAILDLNREKEIPYREKPAVPNIAIPSYSYDVFSITGEGTGGMFRAYRGDIGYIHDHYMRTKDNSLGGSVDVGIPSIVHVGLDINATHAYTQTGGWVNQNPLANLLAFRNSDTTFEASYFRNPGEKSVNSVSFYNSLGGDDVVTANVVQPGGISDPNIATTNALNVYHNKIFTGTIPLTSTTVTRPVRDKRSQTISYLTAQEASIVGVSKYIENYALNTVSLKNCGKFFPPISGSGLYAQYYLNKNFSGNPAFVIPSDGTINYSNSAYLGHPSWPLQLTNLEGNEPLNFSVRWTGNILAPATGTYLIATQNDDGIRVWLNDSLVINDWNTHTASQPYNNHKSLNLVANETYKIKIEYFNGPGNSFITLQCQIPNSNLVLVPSANLFPPPTADTILLPNSTISIENRVDTFRRPNHISEIDVLNPDGRRYIYGIPVYNFLQKDVSFAVTSSNGNRTTGLTSYNAGLDNTSLDTCGLDGYYNNKKTSAYAHSFLLTQILSPDYSDLTGDGIAAGVNHSFLCNVDQLCLYKLLCRSACFFFDQVAKIIG